MPIHRTVIAMIGYLKGVARDGGVVVDASGVGWQVLCLAPLTEGETYELYVHTEVHDSTWALYGFPSLEHKNIFAQLRKVQGISGRIALSLLAELGVDELLRAVATSDIDTLSRVKGLGRKTATLLCSQSPLPAPTSVRDEGTTAVMEALETLGFQEGKAAEAVKETFDPSLAESDNIAAALKRLRTFH